MFRSQLTAESGTSIQQERRRQGTEKSAPRRSCQRHELKMPALPIRVVEGEIARAVDEGSSPRDDRERLKCSTPATSAECRRWKHDSELENTKSTPGVRTEGIDAGAKRTTCGHRELWWQVRGCLLGTFTNRPEPPNAGVPII